MLGSVGLGTAVQARDPGSWVEAGDPVARFLRQRLGLTWPHLATLAFLLYGPIEKLLIPALGGYLHLGGPITQWVPDVEALLLGFLVFPSFYAYYLWDGRGIAEAIEAVERNEGFAKDARYADLMRRTREAFTSRMCLAWALGFSIVAVLVVHAVLWGPEAAVPPWFGPTNVAHRVLALVLIGGVGYVAAQIVIREVLAVLWLGRLFNAIGDDLVVHPYHVDGAGGLGAIGQYAMNLLYLLVTVAVLIGVGSLLPGLRGLGELQVTFWNPLVALLWGLFLILVPIFIGLLIWPPHRAMNRARDRLISVISNRLDQQLAAAEMSLAGDRTTLPETLTEIDRLKELRSIVLNDFPTWPVSEGLKRQIRLSAIIPVVQYVGTMLLPQLEMLLP